jgi:hypothetical protein
MTKAQDQMPADLNEILEIRRQREEQQRKEEEQHREERAGRTPDTKNQRDSPTRAEGL